MFGDMLVSTCTSVKKQASLDCAIPRTFQHIPLFRVAIKLLPDLVYYIQVATNEEADITHLVDSGQQIHGVIH